MPTEMSRETHPRNPRAGEGIALLQRDHRMIRQLFDRYLTTDDLNIRQESGGQILMLLDTHSALEETVFYPAVHSANPALVDEAQAVHRQLDQLVAQLKKMNLNDARCDALFHELADVLLPHLDVEERDLFPAVQNAGLDTQELDAAISNLESSLVSQLAKASR